MRVFEERVLDAVRPVCERHGLLLAGANAMRVHGFTDRPSGNLDLATASATPLAEIAGAVADALRRQGLSARVLEAGTRTGRLAVTDDVLSYEVHLLKEALRDPPVPLGPCWAVGRDDAVGLKVRALKGRGLPGDFIDVAGAAGLYSYRELERLAALHDPEFRVEDLLERLETVDALAADAFLAFGIGEERLDEVRRFAYGWAEDIRLRRSDDGDTDFDPDVPAID